MEEFNSLSEKINKIAEPYINFIYAYDWITDGATIEFSGDDVILTATDSTKPAMAYIDIPCKNIIISFESKSSTSPNNTGASIRRGYIRSSDGTVVYNNNYITTSPFTFTITEDIARIALYVDQVAVSVGTTATFTKLQAEQPSGTGTPAPTEFTKNGLTAVDREARKDIDGLESEVNHIGTDIFNIEQDITNLENNIENITEDISNLENNIEQDISNLKGDLNISNENGYKTETGITWTQGRISPSTGGPVSSDTTAIYSSVILADNYDVSFFATSTGSYTVSVYEYTSAAWNNYASVKLNGDNMPVLFKVTAGRYYRLVVKKLDGTAFAPGELTNFTLLHHASQEHIVNTLNSVTVDVNELQINMNAIKENTENINTAGQGRYYMSSAGVIKPSSGNYIGMPSAIPCEEGHDYTVTVFYDGTTTTNGYYVVWYDNSDVMVGTRQNINANVKYATFTAPETAVKMIASVYNSSGVSADAKISITKGTTPASIYEYPVTAKDTVARSIAYIASNLVTACNASLNKKILTWIDDDTGLSAIPTVKSICDTHGIKCTFACITSRLNDTSLVNLLKSYQEYGFHVTCHSHTHGTWYGDNPYNAEQIENDLIISLEALRDNGFLDSDLLVYPGSSPSRTDIDVVGIVRKWCKCGVKASGTNFTGYGDGEYLINRVFFDASLHDASYYTGILDNYAVNDAPWVVFGSHSSNNTQFDETLVNTVIQYAKANGWTFMTLNEAIKYRQKYFDIKEMYGL